MAGMKDFMNRSRGQGATSESRAVARAMEATGTELGGDEIRQAAQQAIVRRLVGGGPEFRTGFANSLTEWADSPEEHAQHMSALDEAERQSPGVKEEVLSQIGSAKNPQLVEYATQYLAEQDAARAAAAEAAPVAQVGGEAAAPAKPSNIRRIYTNPLERAGTYGQGVDTTQVDPETGETVRIRQKGLGQLLQAAAETRARGARPVTEGQQRGKEYLANPDLYRAAIKIQLQRLAETPLAPEHVAMLSPTQISQITGVPLQEVTPDLAQSLIGQTLTPDQWRAFSRDQRDAIAGPTDFASISADPEMADRATKLAASGQRNSSDNIADDYEQIREETLSTVDAVRAKMDAELGRRGRRWDADTPDGADEQPWARSDRRAAPDPSKPFVLDNTPILRAWRFGWPESKGGEIVRPEQAPSGEFLATMIRPYFDPTRQDQSFVRKYGSLLDDLIREQAATPPLDETFRKNKGMTAKDYAELALEPERGGYDLKREEQQPTRGFPQFMDGVWINRGQPKPALNLGGLLLDPESIGAGSAVDSPISTPEGMSQEPTAPPPGQPPITPSGDEVSMYRRPMNMELLAALLA